MVLSVNVASTAHLAQTDSLHVQRGHLTITLVKCTTRAAWDVLLDNTVIRRHRVFLQVHCVPYLFFFFFFQLFFQKTVELWAGVLHEKLL